MTNNYCTLFNSNYLSRGMTMITSLLECDNEAFIYVFGLDDEVITFFNNLNSQRIKCIPYLVFETEQLLNIKKSRTIAEYCWTLTAYTIYYVIKNYNVSHCTYLDADLYFYSSPAKIFLELSDYSIGIIEHRFPKKLSHLEAHGKYNVQFMYFKNDIDGIKALIWWKEKCFEWCYARLEDGKYGDQLYLNDWVTRFNNVKVISNIGAGMAPWNMLRYSLSYNNNSYQISENGVDLHPLIFFHYHGTKIFKNGFGVVLNYPANYKVIKCIFGQYARQVIGQNKLISELLSHSIQGTYISEKSFNLVKLYVDYYKENNKQEDHLFRWSIQIKINKILVNVLFFVFNKISCKFRSIINGKTNRLTVI